MMNNSIRQTTARQNHRLYLKQPIKALSLFLLSITLGACSWIQLSTAGQSVIVKDTIDIATCTKVGNISATTRQQLIIGSDREKKRVAKELENLARNEAAHIQANTIVPNSTPINGKQNFAAYQCTQ